MIVSGFVHDVGDFVNEHPGGRTLLLGQRGKDATAAFCGGVYEHSNAAHNVRVSYDLAFVWSILTDRSTIVARYDASGRSAWRCGTRKSRFPRGEAEDRRTPELGGCRQHCGTEVHLTSFHCPEYGIGIRAVCQIYCPIELVTMYLCS